MKKIELEVFCNVELKVIFPHPPKSIREQVAQNELNAKLGVYALKMEKQIADFVKGGLEKEQRIKLD